MAEAGYGAEEIAAVFEQSAAEARQHESLAGELGTRLAHARWLYRTGLVDEATSVLPLDLAAELSDRIPIARQTRELAELLGM